MAETERHPQDSLTFLAALIHERIDDCADRALRRTHAALPQLAEPGGLPRPDQRDQALHTLEASVALLVSGSAPSAADLAWYHQLGLRRARQGIALDVVVRSLHLTELVLWELLSDLAGDIDETCPTQLLGRAGTIWMALDQMANAASQGHREAGEQLDVGQRRDALALVNLLRANPSSEHAEELARSLGLDPASSFVAVVHDGEPSGLDLEPDSVVVEEPGRTILLVQPTADAPSGEGTVAEALRRGDGRAGVGLQRERLSGAAVSLRDAEMAYDAAIVTETPVVEFRRDWLEVLAIRHREEYEELVSEAVARIRTAEDTTDTVAAFLAHVGSLTAAGRALQLHANTVAYRLRQFAERTGVDPRTAGGAALTQLALTLAKVGEDIVIPDTSLAAS